MTVRPLLLLLAPLLIAASPAPERAEAWWRDVGTLAADDMEGRRAGSPAHQRAAELVAARFAALGLEPAGENGYFQTVRLEGRVTGESSNVVARLQGSDLAAEHVVLTAHLDGFGIDPEAVGDQICNGALDNAAGVAAMLDIAAELKRRGVRPRRSLLFVIVTGEELGLVGSRWFVRRPTVPRGSIVANLNYDMALPLFPLRSVWVVGEEESSLGADARALGAELGLPVTPDPFPERRSLMRSDHYAFIEAGIPAVGFKFGFAAGTSEAETETAWRATIYHRPGDDAAQSVFREDAIRLHDFIAALALRVANADAAPRWNEGSRYARRGQ